MFIKKTLSEHENVLLGKKVLSWVSSHDLYRGFARQPYWMAGQWKLFALERTFVPMGNLLFRPSNMAAVQNLYWVRFNSMAPKWLANHIVYKIVAYPVFSCPRRQSRKSCVFSLLLFTRLRFKEKIFVTCNLTGPQFCDKTSLSLRQIAIKINANLGLA